MAGAGATQTPDPNDTGQGPPVDGDRDREQSESDNSQSYSDVLGGKGREKEKLQLMTISIYKYDDAVKGGVTPNEVTKLLLDDMKIPQEKIRALDTNQMRRIKVWFPATEDISNYKSTSGYHVRHGIRTEPTKRISNDTWIRVFRTSYDMTDSEFMVWLSTWGTVERIEHRPFVFKDREDEAQPRREFVDTRLAGVPGGDRNVKIKLRSHIPTFCMMGNKKIKVLYKGQIQWCGRCCQPESKCPGGGNAWECEKKKGPKVELKDVWDDIVKNREEINQSEPEACDQVEFSGFKKETTLEDFISFLREKGVTCFEEEEVGADTIPGVFRIAEPSGEEMKTYIKKVAGQLAPGTKTRIRVVGLKGRKKSEDDFAREQAQLAKEQAEAYNAEVEARVAEAKAEEERQKAKAEEAKQKAEAEKAKQKAKAEAKAKEEAEAKARAEAEAEAKAKAEAEAEAAKETDNLNNTEQSEEEFLTSEEADVQPPNLEDQGGMRIGKYLSEDDHSGLEDLEADTLGGSPDLLKSHTSKNLNSFLKEVALKDKEKGLDVSSDSLSGFGSILNLTPEEKKVTNGKHKLEASPASTNKDNKRTKNVTLLKNILPVVPEENPVKPRAGTGRKSK